MAEAMIEDENLDEKKRQEIFEARLIVSSLISHLSFVQTAKIEHRDARLMKEAEEAEPVRSSMVIMKNNHSSIQYRVSVVATVPPPHTVHASR